MRFHSQRQSREAGAVLLEFVVCMLLLIVISAGILEYGNLFGSTVDVSSAVRSAARAGTASTATLATDEAALKSLVSQPGHTRDDIDKVIIYKVTPGNDGPPEVCKTHYPVPPGQKCDVYRAQDLALSPSERAALPAANNWPVSSRVGGVDYLGVWVSVTRRPLVGIIWSPQHYQDHFSMLIEPTHTTSSTPLIGSTDTWALNHNTGTPWVDNWWCWSDGTGCTSPDTSNPDVLSGGNSPGSGGT